MINKIINIDIDYKAMGLNPSPRQTTLTTYILDQDNINCTEFKKRPAVIVCPGGGYFATSAREAEPIAMKYASAGFHTFVLEYSVCPAKWPASIVELSKAVIYVRDIAEEYSIDPNKIFVAGFSAGGHLAASVGVHFNHPDVISYLNGRVDNKPDGIILGYPVISAGKEFSSNASINNLVDDRADLLPLMSLEDYVTEDTPEMFIFHTFNDEIVSVRNSICLADSLEKHGVRFELHIYPNGSHGLALSNNVTSTADIQMVGAVQNWIDMSIRWINDK